MDTGEAFLCTDLFSFFIHTLGAIRDVWPINSSIHHASTLPPASICSALRWDAKHSAFCVCVCLCVCVQHAPPTACVGVQYLCIYKHRAIMQIATTNPGLQMRQFAWRGESWELLEATMRAQWKTTEKKCCTTNKGGNVVESIFLRIL